MSSAIWRSTKSSSASSLICSLTTAVDAHRGSLTRGSHGVGTPRARPAALAHLTHVTMRLPSSQAAVDGRSWDQTIRAFLGSTGMGARPSLLGGLGPEPLLDEAERSRTPPAELCDADSTRAGRYRGRPESSCAVALDEEASAGDLPISAPSRHARVKKLEMLRRTIAQVISVFGSKTTN